MSRLPALGPRGEGWVLGQFVVLVGVIVVAVAGGVPVPEPVLSAMRAVGAAMVIAGVLIVGVAARQLQRALTVLPKPTQAATLVQTGLYAHVRHAIDLGVVIAATGASVYAASPSAALITVALAIWLDLKARREEAWLRGRFVEYADYARRTARFVPRMY